MSNTRTPSFVAQEFGLVSCLWRRELLRVVKERSRWAGALAQPLFFWLIIGSGMAKTFRIPGLESVSALQFFFPGMLAMIILFATIFGTISIVEDRAQGFLQAVLVAPGSRFALISGKVLGVTSLAVIQVGLFALLAPAAGFPVASVRWVVLAALCVLAGIGLTAMNFTVAWILNSVQGYHAVMGIVLFPLWFLSGAMFPRSDGALGIAMSLNPMTYLVDGLRAALSPLAIGPRAASLPVVFAALAVYAFLMLALATWICRRKADPRGRRKGFATGARKVGAA